MAPGNRTHSAENLAWISGDFGLSPRLEREVPPPFPDGVPFLPVAIQIPEVAIYKYVKQHGVCRVRISVIDTKTGALVSELDSGLATTERTYRWLLGMGPHENQRIFFR